MDSGFSMGASPSIENFRLINFSCIFEGEKGLLKNPKK
jgi:hypothetical protein